MFVADTRGLVQYIITAVGHPCNHVVSYSDPDLFSRTAGLFVTVNAPKSKVLLRGRVLEDYLPPISPPFLTNIVYIIVDSFTTPANQLVDYIYKRHGCVICLADGRDLMYFAAIAVIILLVLQSYQDGLSIWRSDKMGMEARIAAKDEMRHVSKYSTSSYWAATAWSLVRAVLIAGICFIIVYPVLVKFSSSLMTEADLFDVTVRWVPRPLTSALLLVIM